MALRWKAKKAKKAKAPAGPPKPVAATPPLAAAKEALTTIRAEADRLLRLLN